MNDALGRQVVIGNSVVYASSKGLIVATVTDFDGEKVTLDNNGSTSKVKYKAEKFFLVADPAGLTA